MDNIFPKTLFLDGTEVSVTVKTDFCTILNFSTDLIYASCYPDIVPDADGVYPISAGGSATIPLLSSQHTVYLLGNGKAVVSESGNGENFSKPTAGGNSGGEDTVARNAISAHVANKSIHLTASDFCNANLLINPDFKINQRGQASYSGNGVYSVDRWMCLNSAVITPTDSGLKVGLPSDAASTATAHVQQIFENYYDFSGKTCTLSINISELAAVGAKVLARVNDSSGAAQYIVNQAISSPGTTSVTFDVPSGIKYMSIWLYGADMRTAGETADSYTVFRGAKLEIGDNATPFIPPDPATELAKCQRYYQIRSTGDIDPVDLRPSMRATPTVTQLADGNYAYSAEL